MNVDGDDNETTMYTMGDGADGSSTSSKPLPKALGNIDKIAKEISKGTRAHSHFIMEGGGVETNRALVHILNQLVQKKIPLMVTKLKEESRQQGEKGPEDIFSHNSVTLKTTISLPRDTMLVILENLFL